MSLELVLTIMSPTTHKTQSLKQHRNKQEVYIYIYNSTEYLLAVEIDHVRFDMCYNQLTEHGKTGD